jgi:hypothetical protein
MSAPHGTPPPANNPHNPNNPNRPNPNYLKNFGFLLLAVWLIFQGLAYILKISIPHDSKILQGINLTAGVILFLHAVKLLHGNYGVFFLGCWLILQNILYLFHLTFTHSGLLISSFGIIIGILLILKK